MTEQFVTLPILRRQHMAPREEWACIVMEAKE